MDARGNAGLPGDGDQFVDRLQGKAAIGIVTVGERPTSVAERTTDGAALKKGISRIFARPGSGAYLLEGIMDVSRGFMKRDVTRPVIVVVTMEGIEYSNAQSQTVLDEIQKSGAALHVLSTHLSYIADRDIQGPLLLAEAVAAPAPCVVMGDLNALDEEAFMGGLLQIFADADAGARRPTFPAANPSVRIDYLLARGGLWRDVVVGRNETASDHRYLAATLDLTSSSS